MEKYREHLDQDEVQRILTTLLFSSENTGGICRVGSSQVISGTLDFRPIQFQYPFVSFEIIVSRTSQRYFGGGAEQNLSDGAVLLSSSYFKVVTINMLDVKQISITEKEERCNTGKGGYLATLTFDKGGFTMHIPKNSIIEALAAFTMYSPDAKLLSSFSNPPK